MNYYTRAFKKYAEFSGRANRAEYWYFCLFNFLVSIGLAIIETSLGDNEALGGGMLSNIYSLIVLVPSIALSVRRMHDVNRRGWFVLVPIYSFILTLLRGTPGDNRFGANPVKELSGQTTSI